MSGLEVNNGLFRDALNSYIDLAKNGFKREREVLGEDIGITATEKLDKKINTGGMVEIEYSVEGKKKAKKLKVSQEMSIIINSTNKKIIDAGFKGPDIPNDHRMLRKNGKTVFIETEVRKELNIEGNQVKGPKFKEVITLSLDDKKPFDITLHYSAFNDGKYFDIIKKPNGDIDITNTNGTPGGTLKPSSGNLYVTRKEVENYIIEKYGIDQDKKKLYSSESKTSFPGYSIELFFHLLYFNLKLHNGAFSFL